MKVVITDHGFNDLDIERQIFASVGAELVVHQLKSPAAVAQECKDANALLVTWVPITQEVIAALDRCQVIVRYGIGTDNIDLNAAKKRNIPVCNVPDYCIDEVADHTLALALALSRQLITIDQRTRTGEWRTTPDSFMPPFRNMTFATLGFGRTARAVLKRAEAFGFHLAAHDPHVEIGNGVQALTLDEVFTKADILSLHLPLCQDTEQIVSAKRLNQLKPTAILLNTARGGLVDTKALALALTNGALAGAGIDVFESEPLERTHPLLLAPNAILTSHVAWFSEVSVRELQRKAAEEILNGLLGKPLRNRLV